MVNIKYAITKYSKNPDESVNTSVIVLDNPLYDKFLFQYSDITFNLNSDNGEVGVWYVCSPVYFGEKKEFSDEDVVNLNDFSKVLLEEIVGACFSTPERIGE